MKNFRLIRFILLFGFFSGLMLIYFNCGSGFTSTFNEDNLNENFSSDFISQEAKERPYSEENLIHLVEKIKHQQIPLFRGFQTLSSS